MSNKMDQYIDWVAMRRQREDKRNIDGTFKEMNRIYESILSKKKKQTMDYLRALNKKIDELNALLSQLENQDDESIRREAFEETLKQWSKRR